MLEGGYPTCTATMTTTITWRKLSASASNCLSWFDCRVWWLLSETGSDLDWNTLPDLRFNRWLLGQKTNLSNSTGPGDTPLVFVPGMVIRILAPGELAGWTNEQICSRCGVQNQKATPTYSRGVDRYTKQNTQSLICSFFLPRASDQGQFVSLFTFTFIFIGDH